jgi:hypothetical protein
MARERAVFGIYSDTAALERGLEALRTQGFRHTDVSVLMPENLGTRDLSHEVHTKAPEGATTGAATGAVAGGVLGWLAGIGALAIPGIGPFLAAGPIVSALAGAGAVGAAGGLIGAAAGFGIPEIEAKRYEGRLREGAILCSVHCDDKEWANRAEEILKNTGATDVVTSSEATADYKP